MNGADYTKARNAADDLLKKYAVEEPLVPVFDIAQREGLAIKAFKPSEKLERIAGFFDFDTKTIFVNDNDPPNRKTFTVAHELAHYILGHKNEDIGILLRFPEMQTQNPTESEANCFAAELLVPKRMLIEVKKKYQLTDKDADLLAKMFGVSKEVMTNQLKYV